MELRYTSIALLFAILIGSIISSCSFFGEHVMNMDDGINMIVGIHAEKATCCQITSHHNPLRNEALDITSKSSIFANFFNAVMSLASLFIVLWLLGDKTLLNYLYRLRRILSITSNYLVQAFSQGLLQPQIYNA